jgi:hypothetical protein
MGRQATLWHSRIHRQAGEDWADGVWFCVLEDGLYMGL